MRHAKHIEIVIWYLVDTSQVELPLPPPKRIMQIHPAVLQNEAYVDRQRAYRHTFRFYIYINDDIIYCIYIYINDLAIECLLFNIGIVI